MKHDLKIWPKYFERVKNGSKTFEVRDNDRDFQCGDIVVLNKYDPEKELYESEFIKFKIGYVLPIEGDKVVFSLLPIKNDNTKRRIENNGRIKKRNRNA